MGYLSVTFNIDNGKAGLVGKLVPQRTMKGNRCFRGSVICALHESVQYGL